MQWYTHSECDQCACASFEMYKGFLVLAGCGYLTSIGISLASLKWVSIVCFPQQVKISVLLGTSNQASL